MLNTSLYVSIYSSSHQPSQGFVVLSFGLPRAHGFLRFLLDWFQLRSFNFVLLYILVPARGPYFNEYRAIDYTTIWIRWERLSPKYVRGILRGYRIYYTSSYKYYYGGSVSNITVGPDTLEMTITGLQPNTEYKVWVKAFTSKGEGSDKNTAYIRTSKSFPWSS